MFPGSWALNQRFSYLQQAPRSCNGKRKQERKMNTTTSLDNSILRRYSPLFWFTLVIPVAIIVIGINFILNPVGASTGYGIPIQRSRSLSFYVDQGHSRHLFRSRGPAVPLEGRPAHNRNTLRNFNFRPIRRWVGHSEPYWLCAAHLYSLGNNALYGDCRRVSS